MQSHDAIVIGGGPAGSTAALLLARRGWRIALVERGRRFRNKACGGCLSPHAVSQLHDMGIWSQVSDLCTMPTRRVRITGVGGTALDLAMDPRGTAAPGCVIDRRQFDQRLIDIAASTGVDVYQPARMRQIDAGKEQARVDVESLAGTRTLVAPLLVGADGLGSRVARATGMHDRDEAGSRVGFAIDFKASARCDLEPEVIEMFLIRGGYLGCVRQDSRVHIGVLVERRVIQETAGPQGILDDAIQAHPRLRKAIGEGMVNAEPHQCLGTAAMPSRPSQIARGPVVLVGDAAGYVEPFTGQGIAWALAGAAALDWSVADVGPGGWNAASARNYEERWSKQIAPGQRWCAGLATLIHRPRLFRLILGLGRRHPAFARVAMSRFMDS